MPETSKVEEVDRAGMNVMHSLAIKAYNIEGDEVAYEDWDYLEIIEHLKDQIDVLQHQYNHNKVHNNA